MNKLNQTAFHLRINLTLPLRVLVFRSIKMLTFFNKPFVSSLLDALRETFPTDKSSPKIKAYDFEAFAEEQELKNILIWFIMNRDNNRAGDLLKIEGDIVYFDLGDSFSIRPLTCGLYLKERHVLDFTPKSQQEYTDLFGAWAEIVETTNPDLARTLRVVGKRDISYDDKEVTLKLNQSDVHPELLDAILSDRDYQVIDIPTHPEGMEMHGYMQEVFSGGPFEFDPVPKVGDHITDGSRTVRITDLHIGITCVEEVGVKNRSFRSSALYEPLKEFLVALSQDPVPMAAILALTQADNCSESHFFVGNGKLQNLTLEVDGYKVEITSGALCRRVGLKVINRSTLTSLEINAEDFENLLAEL